MPVQVLSAATPGNREAGLRRLQQSGVRVLTETAVAEVKEGGTVLLRGVKVSDHSGSVPWGEASRGGGEGYSRSGMPSLIPPNLEVRNP